MLATPQSAPKSYPDRSHPGCGGRGAFPSNWPADGLPPDGPHENVVWYHLL